VAGPLAQFALRRADQAVIVTTPEGMAANAVLAALEHLAHERPTVASNMSHARRPADLTELERRLRESGLHRSVAVPYDEQLAGMLDSATYPARRAPAAHPQRDQAARARRLRAARLMRPRGGPGLPSRSGAGPAGMRSGGYERLGAR
jgi:MinD superfamily P-loop ATPase